MDTNNLPPPPARFSKPWFRAQFALRQEQSRSAKGVEVLLLLGASFVVLKYSWKIFWAWFYYLFEYAKAALGNDVLLEPCVSILRELSPWMDLDWEDYWRWNRCIGNEHGFERQGYLMPTPSGILAWLLDPHVFSSYWVRSESCL